MTERTAEQTTVAADELSDLYAALAVRLRQIVGGKVRAPDPVVEDACQFAWSSLVNHRDRVLRETALGWLATTAVREAFRLIRHQHRELPLERLADVGGPPRPLATPTDELVEHRAKLT